MRGLASAEEMVRPPARVILFWILLSLVAMAALHKFSEPFAELHRQQVENQALTDERDRLLKESQEIQRQMKLVSTPQGIKSEAHRQGYVLPGERRLIIQPAPSTNAPPPPPTAPVKRKPSICTVLRNWAEKHL
jgi:hypothetical protein